MDKLLEVLKELNVMLGHLEALGVKVNGQLDLADILGMLKH